MLSYGPACDRPPG